MRKITVIILLSFFAVPVFAQVRVSKLVIKAKEVYYLGQSDILVADSLILKDSARIVLNTIKRENFIRAKVAIFGNGCVIDGRGISGKAGRKGRDGETPIGPCQDGSNGRVGSKGLDGGHAVNLFLYFDKLIIRSKLFINLRGGNGGNGGEGGHGGSGSPGTLHCFGGNGGNGANGTNGGNGGNGGTLTINCPSCPPRDELFAKKIRVDYDGGTFGFGGRGGYEGAPGLAPSRRGVSGKRGFEGANGKWGNIGDVKIETN
jgi:hypothetical protein